MSLPRKISQKLGTDALPGAFRNGEMSLAEALRESGYFLRRQYGSILLVAFGCALVALLVVAQMEKRYKSTLLLMVEQPARSPIETEIAQGALRDSFVEGQIYILESNALLREVIRRTDLLADPDYQRQPPSLVRRAIGGVKSLLGLNRPPVADDGPTVDPAEAYAVRVLRKALEVDREGETDVISISVTANGPRKAARIADAVGAAFVDNRERTQLEKANRVSGWLDQRALELQAQLTAAENAVAAYKIENNLMSGTTGVTLSEQQLVELNAELIRTRAELAERRAAYSRAQELIDTGGDIQTLPRVQDSDIVATLRADLIALTRREADLAGRNPNDPRLPTIRDERAVVERQIAEEVGRILDVIANEVRVLEAREQLVAEALRDAGGQSGIDSRSSVELRELERRAAAYQELYQRYLSNTGLADETVSFLASGVEIVDNASVPLDAVFPPTKLIVLFGLIFGAGLGTVAGLIREAMLPGFMTAGEVTRRLGQPVLASVPVLPDDRAPIDQVLEEPVSMFSEAVRSLRHGLTHDFDGDTAPVVMLTSSGPGEGKTSLAASIAASASQAELFVLLVDADMRRGGLTRMFGMAGRTGLSELLGPDAPKTSGTIDNRILNLDFLPTGLRVASPTDLIASPAMRTWLDDMRQIYDLIVIDGPPVANMADATALAELSDAVGFVIKWNDTPTEVAEEALRRLDPEKLRGVALNAVDLRRVASYGERYEQYVLDSMDGDGANRATQPA